MEAEPETMCQVVSLLLKKKKIRIKYRGWRQSQKPCVKSLACSLKQTKNKKKIQGMEAEPETMCQIVSLLLSLGASGKNKNKNKPCVKS